MNTSGFALDADIAFLNHGSFGAVPIAVLEAQASLRSRLERQPVDFYLRQYQPLLDEARGALATFLGAQPEDLVPVRNATQGVNAVLRGFAWQPGDGLLITDHGYNACNAAARQVATWQGLTLQTARIPFPLASPEEIIAAIETACTPATRIALVDHVTSPTGLVFPIAEIVKRLRARGILVLVDGAHAPGMVPVDLDQLGATWYTGNLHKWVCAPKGAAFLWAERAWHAQTHALSISHGYTQPSGAASLLHTRFDWTGTDDPTAFFCVPDALRTVPQLAGTNWEGVRSANRALALEARTLLAEGLGVEPPAPEACLGAMVALPLPESPQARAPGRGLGIDPLQATLWETHRIEVPIIPFGDGPRLVRVSAQRYNERADYDRLLAALRTCGFGA